MSSASPQDVRNKSAQDLRATLNFEQQARFDALYDQRKKQVGTARTLSLPLLGTFGLDQFYLGHTVRGVLSLLFSWTLIPTVVALFDLFTGDINRQVDYANQRVAQQVYLNVIDNTVKDQVPVAAAPVVNPPTFTPAPEPVVPAATDTVVVAEAEAMAAPALEAAPAAAPEAVIAADSIADPAPAAPVEEVVAAEADETATTTGNFTRTDTTATWEAGMAEPVTTSETQTLTVGETDVAPVEAEVAEVVAPAETPVYVAPPAPAAEEPVVVVLDETPAATAADAEAVMVAETPEAAAVVVESTPVAPPNPAPTGDFAPGEGVLVFFDDAPVAEAPAPVASAPVDEVAVDETQQSGAAETVSETTSYATQQYQNGELVSASRATTTITGEISTLVTDHSSLLEEVEARMPEPSGWVDVSTLHGDSATATSQATNAPGAVSLDTTNTPGGDVGNGGTNTPGGDLGNGGTNTPGGDLGNGGSNTPGGDLGSGGTTDGGNQYPDAPHRGPEDAIPS